MLLELDDMVIKSTGLSDQELRIELAVQLYEDGKITVGQGGAMTGLGHVKFQHELGEREIPGIMISKIYTQTSKR